MGLNAGVAQPPESLLMARRALEGMAGVSLLTDWSWNMVVHRWVLHLQLTAEVLMGGSISRETEWYILADPIYPWGDIDVHPAKIRGIELTFPHQGYNGWGDPKTSWRQGKVCLSTGVRSLGRYGYDTEPLDAPNRLRWHVQRALAWLSAASRGDLIEAGDPFELPDFAITSLDLMIAFSESQESLCAWQTVVEQVGLADLAVLPAQGAPRVVLRFSSLEGRRIMELTWGAWIRSAPVRTERALWVRLPGVPVIPPWQSAQTWKELVRACAQQDVNLEERILTAARFLRDGKRHVVLVGFPVPATIGGPNQVMHWQPFLLPQLSSGKQTAKGFRPNQAGYSRRDQIQILTEDLMVDWLASENWNPQFVSIRGRLPDPLVEQEILLVGAGALGASMAEMLIRGGVRKLTVLDFDVIHAGNLARHTLTLDDLSVPKASALANHLNRLSPHVDVNWIDAIFPAVKGDSLLQILRCGIIIDCTGQDRALHALERFAWDRRRLFASFSVGFGARRVFCFGVKALGFPYETFQRCLEPYLQQELEDNGQRQLPREGVGCWHPFFPARSDDVWLAASVAVKCLAEWSQEQPIQPRFGVYEQHYGHDARHFTGVVQHEPD